MTRHTFIRYIAPNLGAILVLVLFDRLGAQSRAFSECKLRQPPSATKVA